MEETYGIPRCAKATYSSMQTRKVQRETWLSKRLKLTRRTDPFLRANQLMVELRSTFLVESYQNYQSLNITLISEKSYRASKRLLSFAVNCEHSGVVAR